MATSLPDPSAARLAMDHREIDRLFQEAWAALEQERPAEAHQALDRTWMRLAVHIRAEHKVLFPAVAQIQPGLAPVLQALRQDHDTFMSALAEAVMSLKVPPVDWRRIRSLMEDLRPHLDRHNALEEAQVYPLADHLPEEPRARLAEGVSRELADLPARYRTGTVNPTSP